MVERARFCQRSIGRDAAIELAGSRWWNGKSADEVFAFQVQTKELCMDFGDFHEAAQDALGRSVWTHEFVNPSALWEEFVGTRAAPSIEAIFALIPADKLIVVAVEPVQREGSVEA